MTAMDELLKELRAKRRATDAAKARDERIRNLFIQVRQERPDLQVKDLEAQTGVDRAIISRMTAKALKASAAPAQD